MNTWLDCESPAATEQSLAAVFGIDRTLLHMRCSDFDLDDFYRRTWGPASELARRVLDMEVEERVYPAYYFHATRLIRAEAPFADGIRPRHEALEGVWGELRGLASQYCPAEAWQEFRLRAETTFAGASDRSQAGPFGFLVREVPLYQAATHRGPWHDYLGVPEIVEDISIAFCESFGVDLVNDYTRASQPYLAKFKAQGSAVDVATALLYLCHSVHRREIDAPDLGVTYNARGRCIRANAIVAVEIDPHWEAP
jgi:hypothetical protein